VVELASDYLEGVLGDLEQRLDAHLRECDGCEAYVAQLRETIASLRALGEADTGVAIAGAEELVAEFGARHGHRPGG
jgi:hypothetical protein